MKEQFLGKIIDFITNTGIKIVVSVVFLIIVFKLIDFFAKRITKKAEGAAEKKKVDKTIYRTLSYAARIVLKVLAVICVIGYLGIDTSGITALVASLGVGVGLAVNGTLANFAGGVLLLITRPFKDDDYIEACGYSGTVEDIHICYTKLRTPDNKVVYVPNGTLSTSTIVNYSEKDIRRLDLAFSISYSNDFEKAKKVIEDVYNSHSLVLKDPAPSVRVSKHSESSIELTAKVWCKNDDYWTLYFDMLEGVKKAFDGNGIEIPYNQLDVHIKND